MTSNINIILQTTRIAKNNRNGILDMSRQGMNLVSEFCWSWGGGTSSGITLKMYTELKQKLRVNFMLGGRWSSRCQHLENFD